MIALPLPLDFTDTAETTYTSKSAPTPALVVSYHHPTLGNVYVAPVPFIDAKGKLYSIMTTPVRWLTIGADGVVYGEQLPDVEHSGEEQRQHDQEAEEEEDEESTTP